MMVRLATIALAAIPMSIGMGYVVQALFPAMSGNTAGLIAGAITLPSLLLVMSMGMPE